MTVPEDLNPTLPHREEMTNKSTEQPKLKLSRKVYEWNEHYKPSTKSKAAKDHFCPAVDEQMNIADKVSDWDKHYQPTRRSLSEKPGCESCHEHENSEQLASKINLWENYYHPRKSQRNSGEGVKEKLHRSCSSQPSIAELVVHWNERYAPLRRTRTFHVADRQHKEKVKLKMVTTSIMVKHWDEHYMPAKHDLDSLSSPKQPIKQHLETKPSKTSKLTRKPSIIKERIEKLHTQPGPAERTKYVKGVDCNRFTCRSNFDELRSKFTISKNDATLQR